MSRIKKHANILLLKRNHFNQKIYSYFKSNVI